jgi:hypothetical protein
LKILPIIEKNFGKTQITGYQLVPTTEAEITQITAIHDGALNLKSKGLVYGEDMRPQSLNLKLSKEIEL